MRRPEPKLTIFLLLSLLARLAAAQTINTIAGFGPPPGGNAPDGAMATGVRIGSPPSVAVDNAGNLYLASPVFNRVFKVDARGIVTTVAGNGSSTFSEDGPATSSGLSPARVAVDAAGNVYIAEQNGAIQMVSGGILTTITGSIPATAIAANAAGILYVAGSVGVQKLSGFGGLQMIAAVALINGATAIAVDSAGNVYVAQSAANTVSKISGGIVTVVAGNGSPGYSPDGSAASTALLNAPAGIAVDGAGNLYIADSGNQRVREVSGGIITTVAGNGSSNWSGDGGAATSAGLNPVDVAVDTMGNLYIADGSNQRVRKVSGGIISTVAGVANPLGDGGPALSALLSSPRGVAVDPAGNYYIADTGNNRIRMVSGGIITTVAGNGSAGYSGDGLLATAAGLNGPSRVALDSSGNLYIADTGNNVIRKVSAEVITTVAGNGIPDFTGDGGSATSAALNNPSGVAVDAGGSLYIADSINNRVRRVSGGVIATIAGNGGSTYGDGGLAINASLSNPSDVAVDSAGNLYIADTGHQAVREVSAGIITTAFSTANHPSNGLDYYYGAPTGLALETSGSFCESDGNVVRCGGRPYVGLVPFCGECGVLYGAFSGDGGPAADAGLNSPAGIAIDKTGALYIADTGNNRIRRVCNIPITVATNPSGLVITIDGAPYPSPQTTSFCAAETHAIGIPASQPSGAVFVNWSDGGAPTHTITVQSATTYTATLTVPQYQLTTAATPPGAGTIAVSPFPSNGFYAGGTAVQFTAIPKPGFLFANWSGDLSGTANPQSLTMNGPHQVTANFIANPSPFPTVVGVEPATGNTFTQSFTFRFSHPSGYQHLSVLNILINNFLDGRNACYLAYVVPSNALVLVNDTGQSQGPYAGSVVLGSSSPIQNSKCAVTLVSATGSGTTFALALDITFQSAFGGNKVQYLAAQDVLQNNSGWQALGTWQVPFTPGGTISVGSLSPARGAAASGTPQTFTLSLTDTKGAADIGIVNLLVNNFIDGRQACYLAYVASSNTLLLVDDTGDAGGPFAGMVLNGTGSPIQNSQCVIGAPSSAVLSGNTLTLALNITFSATLTGNQVLYVAGRDAAGANNSAWQAVGTWTVQ